jgi:hypothetical protein
VGQWEFGKSKLFIGLLREFKGKEAVDLVDLLDELLKVEALPERVEELMKFVEIDLPVSDEIKRFLLKQQVEMFNLEYGRYAAGTKMTRELVEDLLTGSIDIHVHGGSDPFERLQLEDEILMDATKARMRAIVIKTWYTPSASRNQLLSKWLNQWASQNGLEPVKVFGGITLCHAVGGFNPIAVKHCLGFPNFKYVWMPMSDSYYHQLVVFNRKGTGLKYLTEGGKIIPEVKEILRIIADNDLVLASGHYNYHETAPLMEEAKKLGVRRMEVVHPTIVHSRSTIPQMKALAKEGVRIGVVGIASVNPRYLEGIRYLFKIIREVGADNLIWGSDSGQIQNPTHIEGMRWFIKILLANGITKEEVEKIIKITPAKHLGLA